MAYFVRSLLLLRYGRGDNEVAFPANGGQLSPGAVRHQTVTGLQLRVTHTLGKDITAAVDGQHADAVTGAKPYFPDRLPNQPGTRWNNDFGNTRPARVEQATKCSQARLHPALVFQRKPAHHIPRTHDAEYRTHPNHLVRGWRQPGLIRVADGQQHGRVFHLFGIRDGHTDQGAVYGNQQLVNVALDAVNIGKIGLGLGRHTACFFLGLGQEKLTGYQEVDNPRRQQCQSDRGDIEKMKSFERLDTGRQ